MHRGRRWERDAGATPRHPLAHAWKATIADKAGVIAAARCSPALPFDLVLVCEPEVEEGRAPLRRGLTWAMEEYGRRVRARAGIGRRGRGQ